MNSLRGIAPGVLLARRTRAVLAVATLASHESVVSIDLAGKPQPGPGDDSQGLSFGIASCQVDQAPTFFRLINAVLRGVHNSYPWLCTAAASFRATEPEYAAMVPGKSRIMVISRDLLIAAPGRRDITLFLLDFDARISVDGSRHERASNV